MFKLFIATAALALASFAQAENLPENTLGLYKLSTPNITVSNFKCPEGKICAASLSSVKLDYTLSGCLDTMAPLSYFVSHDPNSVGYTVYVSAKAYANKESMNVLCYRAPIGSAEIVLMGVLSASDVTVIDLDQEATAITQ